MFGMAILSGGGRVESNLTFSGSNLGIITHCITLLYCIVLIDVLFQITDNKNLSFQHTSGLVVQILCEYFYNHLAAHD